MRDIDSPPQSLSGLLDAVKELGRLELIAVLRADQLRRWRRGERLPAEVYLRELALGDDPELALDVIFSEFVLRRDALGEAPSLDDYLARFPQFETALRHQHLVEALWQGAVQTLARGERAPATEAAPPGSDDGTVLQSGGGGSPAGTPALPGYELRGELGRGGMGLVLKGHDLHLGRDLAVKLLRDDLRGQPHLVRRFLNEARICGRLQHPGVVPVHALGALPDGRPYFTMKLVEGRTLADLLDGRADPARDLPRLLGIFEQVCQTLAYAHSKAVIHRDLKPANVMVGAFGEVQVMDWGLAKVLASRERQRPEGEWGTEDGLDEDCAFRTQTGGAVGTLPYMPPEQARGEVGLMDERCDVFGLGALLCEVLTGRPPFRGRDGAELLARARAGDDAEALAALDGCGADPELVRLAKSCLAADPDDRPRDAGVVARAMTAHLAGVQERLRAAEVGRAAAQARADEARATAAAERRARRLAAVALVLALLGVAGGLWWAQKRAAQERQVEERRTAQERSVNGARDRFARALAAWDLPGARAAIVNGEAAVSTEGPDGLRQLVAEMADQMALAGQLDRIRLNAAALVDGKLDYASADREYAALFREQRLAEEGEDEDAVARRIQGSPLREQLVAALDDWAAATEDGGRRRWLLTVARQAQPDEWGDRFRDARVWTDPAALAGLARDADVAALSPPLLTALAVVLQRAGVNSVPFLKRAQARHPSDFWLNFLLGNGLYGSHPDEAVAYYRAAIAVRQETSAVYHNLGALLSDNGRRDEGIEASRTAVEHDPQNVQARSNIAVALVQKGEYEEAVAECLQALNVRPGCARVYPILAEAHFGMANRLYREGDRGAAVEEYRRAITLDDNHAQAHSNLAATLADRGRLEEAVWHHRRVLAIKPADAQEHFHLGLTLRRLGRLDEAVDEFRQAIAIEPGHDTAPGALGEALLRRGQFVEAVESLRRSLRQMAEGHDKRPTVEAWIRQYEPLVPFDAKLPAVLRGDAPLRQVEEQLSFARFCWFYKHRYAASARFYADAFAGRPELAEDLDTSDRYSAACAAALAGVGNGEDANRPDLLPDKAALAFRRQALGWLRADLAAWRRRLDGDEPAARAAVGRAMRQWQTDAALFGVRDPEALSLLPEAERPGWERLWNEVAALLARAGAAP
jgi:serine/threonine-protein kinase